MPHCRDYLFMTRVIRIAADEQEAVYPGADCWEAAVTQRGVICYDKKLINLLIIRSILTWTCEMAGPVMKRLSVQSCGELCCGTYRETFSHSKSHKEVQK
jgi:hypothetical protein